MDTINKKVYLDNAGSTQVSPNALKAATDVCLLEYANPSAIHLAGANAKKYIDNSKEILAEMLGAEKNEIYFTSGGTESNNIAVLGVAKANKKTKRHIITTKIEHASLKNTALSLEDEGFLITLLDTDKNGYIDMRQLENSITEDTCLVSIMHVNNEIGTIQNLEAIGTLIKNKNPNTLFHVDGVQAFGKYNINVNKAKIDLYSISGHKIHAMKGTGALYIRKNVKIKNVLYGGSQENGMRPGTENVPGIVSLGVAAKEMKDDHEEIMKKLKSIKYKLYNSLAENIDEVYLNGPSLEEAAYHILNIHIKRIKAQILINALSGEGIYVSAGSACSAKNRNASTTLVAIGLAKEDIESSIRISFSKYTKEEDMDFVVEKIKENVEKIRKVYH